MLNTLKVAAAATTLAVAAIALSGTAQARFGASVAADTEALLQPVHYYGYRGYGYYGYPRYYGGYGYRGYGGYGYGYRGYGGYGGYGYRGYRYY